jgi:hypothetical protein
MLYGDTMVSFEVDSGVMLVFATTADASRDEAKDSE